MIDSRKITQWGKKDDNRYKIFMDHDKDNNLAAFDNCETREVQS